MTKKIKARADIRHCLRISILSSMRTTVRFAVPILFLLAFLGIFVLTQSGAFFHNNVNRIVDISVVPRNGNSWVVIISSNKPICAVEFESSVSINRVADWKPIDPSTKFENNNSLLCSGKNESKKITIEVTPSTIKQVAKSYSPFAKFSDQTILVHSGQFRLSKVNNEVEFNQSISFERGNYESVRNTVEVKRKVTICSACPEQYVMYSPANVRRHGSSALLSDNLPKWITRSIVDEYERSYGVLKSKFNTETANVPTLFIGYDPNSEGDPHVDAGYNSEQIMMIFKGPEWRNQNDHLEFHAMWILVHELVHHWNAFLFEPNSFSTDNNTVIENHAWLYEGGSEAVAFYVLAQSKNEFFKGQVIEKGKRSVNVCKALSGSNKNIYDCGLAFNLLADSFCARPNSILDVWSHIFSTPEKRLYDYEAFISAVKKCGANDLDLLTLKAAAETQIVDVSNLNDNYFSKVMNDNK